MRKPLRRAEIDLAEFEDRWKSENHALQWAQTLRDYVYPVIGDVPLGEIGVDHIVRVLDRSGAPST